MSTRRIELADGGTLFLDDAWIPEAERASTYAALDAELPWATRPIRILGREILQPRLVAWLGDPGARYVYSGVENVPLPWTPRLGDLRDRLRSEGFGVNACLANKYRDGRDSMGFHADAEPELGPDPTVVSISLGASRRFQLRHRKRNDERLDLDLGDGTLLVMSGTTQRYWRHAVPKTTRPVGPRINLTFRTIVAPVG